MLRSLRTLTCTEDTTGVAVWLDGNALASINAVALRQTRLVLRWVTVCGRVNQVNSAFYPLWDGKIK